MMIPKELFQSLSSHLSVNACTNNGDDSLGKTEAQRQNAERNKGEKKAKKLTARLNEQLKKLK